MKEYNHINDCWNEIREVSDSGELTLEKLNDILDNFPRWSGDWSVHFIDSNTVSVTNSYYDRQYDNYEEYEEIFSINWTEDEIEELSSIDIGGIA